MSDNVTRRSAAKMVVLGMVLALVTAVPAAVWAGHQFDDVPDGHFFHDEISAIADAGITAGFVDGGFHPTDPVTRQAMAAFLERGLGRVGSNATTELLPLSPNLFTTLTGTFLDAGATAAGTGFALLTGTAWFQTGTPADCPCRVTLYLTDPSNGSNLATADFDIAGTASGDGTAATTGTVQAVVSVAGNSTRQFKLYAFLRDTTNSVSGSATLSALYVPFGLDGDDTLAYCSERESEPNGTFFLDTTPYSADMMGCIEPAGDHDIFSVIVGSAGQMIRASTFGLGGPGTCDTDTFIRIHNSGGTVLLQDDNSGPASCSLAATGTVTPGTYYVRVLGPGGATGSYQLLVEVEDS